MKRNNFQLPLTMLILCGPETEVLKMHSPLEAPAQVHRDAAALFLCTKARHNADSISKGLNWGAFNCGNTAPLLKKNAAHPYTSTWKNVHDILSEIRKWWNSRLSMIPFL